MLELRNITKIYGQQASAVRALDRITLGVNDGEFVAITGPSGSGKSTTLSIFGILETPTAGEYLIEGIPVQNLAKQVLALLRNNRFGFVFQTFNLLPRTSALENVMLPLIYAGVGTRERTARAKAALDSVGLPGRYDAHPNQLSGGQQQRVAIARAIVNNPSVILADEPTGNLDSKMGKEIMQLIQNLNRDRGITVLMVTHDASCAAYATREVSFLDGKIERDRSNA